jgi:hypothetical protein
MNKVKRAGLGLVAVVAVGLAGLVPLDLVRAAPAAAEPTPVPCDPGEACIVDRPVVVYRTAGNAPNIWVRVNNGGYIWNHGVRYPGLDHIQVRTMTPNGRLWQICLHYGPNVTFDQPEPTAGRLVPGERVMQIQWRGECSGNEDTWH